jgi:inorganic triphosphatase YgiF
MSGHEVEIKIALPGEGAWGALGRHLGKLAAGRQSSTFQENRFYDTPDGALATMGWRFRVRLEWDGGKKTNSRPDRVLLTLKGPSKEKGGAVSRPEREQEVAANRVDELLAGEVTIGELAEDFAVGPLGESGLGDLAQLVTFTNLRRTFEIELGGSKLELELDRTDFGKGVVHHELEAELPDTAKDGEICEVRQALGGMLSDIGVGWKMASKGKFATAWQLRMSGATARSGDSKGRAQ